MHILKTNLFKVLSGTVLSIVLTSVVLAQDEDKVLAKVDGMEITQSEFDQRLGTLPPQLQVQFQSNKKQFLNELINQKLLLGEAKRQKIDKDQKLLTVLDQLKSELMVQRLVEKEILEKVNVTDDEAKEYYDQNKQNFVTPEKRHAYHILFSDEDKAKEVRDELENGGDFEKLAKENSVGPSGPRGGDLGFVQRGQLVPEFEDTAFKLKIDEISDIVKTQFGYHLIKVTEINPTQQMKFDEVKDNVVFQLQQQRQRQLLTDYLEELKKKYKIKIMDNELS